MNSNKIQCISLNLIIIIFLKRALPYTQINNAINKLLEHCIMK